MRDLLPIGKGKSLGYYLAMRKALPFVLCFFVAGLAMAAPGASILDVRLRLAKAACAGLPDGVYRRIEVAPQRFLALLDALLATDPALLILVDKRHALDSGFEPADLVSLNGTGLSVSREDLRLRASIMPALREMDAAARKAGVVLLCSSSYRSYAYQDTVYRRNVAQLGRAEADLVSAMPGNSQHQLGTVVDFGTIDDAYAVTKAGKWLAAEAWRYGFSLSYPKGMEAETGYSWECWHYRYITRSGCLLEREYFGMQQYLLEFLEAYLTLEKG